MYSSLYKNIAKSILIVGFMLTLGTYIHEQGHVLAVKLTGGHVIGVEYHLTEASTIYEGGYLPIIALSGPILGSIGLWIFAKSLSFSKEWTTRAMLINLTASSHDFAYFMFNSEVWFLIISVPCLFLVTRSINEFYEDLHKNIRIYRILDKVCDYRKIKPTLSPKKREMIESKVSKYLKPIQNSQP